MLVHRLQERIESHRDFDIVLAPSYLVLQPMSLQIDRRKFKLAAQNCHWQDEGAYTGEISATMLHDLVHYVIVGHSERRHIFGETDDEIAKKVAAVVRNHMTPILCIGETSQERKEGETKQVLHDQLMVGLKDVTSDDVRDIVIAYEPVWAIGTGEYASADQVKAAVDTIRHNVRELYGHVENDVRVLYGGSVEPDITRGYMEVDGVDGLLVGGASLNYEQFSNIVSTSYQTTHDDTGGDN